MTAKEALQFLLNPDVYVKFKNRNAISVVLHNLISKSSKYLRFYMPMGSRTENKLLTDIKVAVTSSRQASLNHCSQIPFFELQNMLMLPCETEHTCCLAQIQFLFFTK